MWSWNAFSFFGPDSPPQRPWNALVWTVRSLCMNGMFLAWKFFAGAPRHPDCTCNAPCGDCSVSVSTPFGIRVHSKRAFFALYRHIPIRRRLYSLMSLERIFQRFFKTTYSPVRYPRSHSYRMWFVSPVIWVLYWQGRIHTQFSCLWEWELHYEPNSHLRIFRRSRKTRVVWTQPDWTSSCCESMEAC